MLIMKKFGIQADSGALCPYLGIKVTCSLQCGQKTKLLNFVRIIYFESLITSSTEIQYSRYNTIIHTAILPPYCSITLKYMTDCNILHRHCNISVI